MEIIMRSKLACYCVVWVHFRPNIFENRFQMVEWRDREISSDVEWRWWIKWNTTKSRLLQEPYIYRYIFKITACFLSIITSYNSNTLEPFSEEALVAEDVLAKRCTYSFSSTLTATNTHPHYTYTHISVQFCSVMICSSLQICYALLRISLSV